MSVATNTGSITYDFSKLEPYKNYTDYNLDTSFNHDKNKSASSGSYLSFFNEYQQNKNVHFGVASSTGSITHISSSLIQTKDVDLIPFSGHRKIFGFNKKIMGHL